MNPPSHWQKEISPFPEYQNIWRHKIASLTVVRSISTLRDKRRYIHISLSRPDRLPTWEEVSKVKSEFAGDDSPAYHVIPAKKDYVNLHKFCLHIWVPEDKNETVNLQEIIDERAF